MYPRNYILILFIVSLSLVITGLYGQQGSPGNYEATILRAEQLMDQKDYRQAKAEYENALRIRPDANYPRIKLQQIREVFADPDDTRRYNNYISEGNRLFNMQNYKEAREQYFWANVLKPDERYPLTRIKETDEQIRELERKLKLFNKSITTADSLLRLNQYQQALNEYLYASGLLPAENYPRNKINEINSIFQTARKEQKEFENTIEKADQLYMIQDYNAAIIAYKTALEMRPGDRYTASMIDRINAMADDQRSLESIYAQVIENADRLRSNDDLVAAKAAFEHALKLKPEENYPKDQIAGIETILAERAQSEEAFEEFILLAMQHYETKDYESALAQFRNAEGIRPLDNEKENIVNKITNLLEEERAFRETRENADNLFLAQQYDAAREQYNQLLLIKPADKHAIARISEIDSIVARFGQIEESYTNAILTGDKAFQSTEYEKSLDAYKQALALKPEESYPASRINEIQVILDEIRANQLAFDQNISNADNKFNSGQFQQAISFYQEALKYKPGNQYAETRIAEARSLVSEAEINEAYSSAVSTAGFHEDSGDLASALDSWQTAASLKPSETLPQEKIAELGAIVATEKRKKLEAYEKAIADGNRFFNTKVFDQAIEAFTEAGRLKPDESYPAEMIADIRKYIEERAIVDLVSDPVNIVSGDEKRFNFSPVDMRVRRNNYVILTMRFESPEASRFFLNYGLDDQRSGGIVVRNPGGKQEKEFIVRVSSQDRWYRIDNNWISIYPEGSDVEVVQLRISSGD
jgi:tetratricopeptide (TPR) repeat protein